MFEDSSEIDNEDIRYHCQGQILTGGQYFIDIPAREIRFIVPFPPGAGNDTVGRTIAGKLQESLGQDVIVENRGGAGGTLGTDIAAKAPPDGYTMLINNISLAVNATFFPKLPYNTQKDLTPVSIVGRQPSVVLVHANLEAKSVRELVRLARQTPGQRLYGSGCPGSSAHLATERLFLVSGMQMKHVTRTRRYAERPKEDPPLGLRHLRHGLLGRGGSARSVSTPRPCASHQGSRTSPSRSRS